MYILISPRNLGAYLIFKDLASYRVDSIEPLKMVRIGAITGRAELALSKALDKLKVLTKDQVTNAVPVPSTGHSWSG